MKKKQPINSDRLKESYDKTLDDAEAFRKAVSDQLSSLFKKNKLRPAIPIESRTKEWTSILLKLDRLQGGWNDVLEIWDLVGLRTVFLFPEEAAQAGSLLEASFEVVYRKVIGQDRSPSEFGYKSDHFVVRLPQEWLKVPTLRKFLSFQAEIQVRTLSQHNWAVAARLLQYNEPSFAPPSVQRSLFRVAALLEVVDLELDRVRIQRDDYRKQSSAGAFDQVLNIDLLEAILKARLPKIHGLRNDDYFGLLSDLNRFGISKGSEVITLIDRHLEQALANDKIAVNQIRLGDSTYAFDAALFKKGVFYSNVGLMQNILNLQFGSNRRKMKNSKKQSENRNRT